MAAMRRVAYLPSSYVYFMQLHLLFFLFWTHGISASTDHITVGKASPITN
jgi:hypothetical protein